MLKHRLSGFSLFSIILVLGFFSGLPVGLFSTTLQSWFAISGSSVFFVSSLSLFYLPFLFRFLWGFWADQYFFHRLGRRKTWIMVIQLLLCIVIECMAWGDPVHSPQYLLFMGFLVATLSSIQDLVIDAHRIEYLPREYYGYGAVVAVYAIRVALLLSGGFALIFAQYWGFSWTYAALGLLFLPGIWLVYRSKEPDIPEDTQYLKLGPIKDFFQQPNCLSIVGLLVCTKLGEVFVSNTSPMIIPFMLQGLGLSLVKIAYLNKVFGLGAQLLGAGLSAFFVSRVRLIKLIFVFGLFEVMANLLFYGLSVHPSQGLFLWGVVAIENLATGLCSTVMVAFLMGLVNPRYTATQYSFWIILAILPRLLAGPIGGYFAAHYGWSSVFELSSFLTALFVIFWWRLQAVDEVLCAV